MWFYFTLRNCYYKKRRNGNILLSMDRYNISSSLPWMGKFLYKYQRIKPPTSKTKKKKVLSSTHFLKCNWFNFLYKNLDLTTACIRDSNNIAESRIHFLVTLITEAKVKYLSSCLNWNQFYCIPQNLSKPLKVRTGYICIAMPWITVTKNEKSDSGRN